MALWLIRAGKQGQGEQRFLDDDRIYWCWSMAGTEYPHDGDREIIKQILGAELPEASDKKIAHGAGQTRSFLVGMQAGDWAVLPSRFKPAVHVAEITGPYCYDAAAEMPWRHYREVKWIATDVPRSNFDQDILYSLGAFMTTCRIRRNNAEERVRKMAANGWKAVGGPVSIPATATEGDETGTEEGVTTDLEQAARDQIASLIIARFKGHDMARLVDAILQAQGYTTYVSPPGPDKGVDILAAPGPMGFGNPRLCVQVKSGDRPLDRATLDQLIGTMQNMNAEQGLLVSWGGFKSSIDKEKATQFFRVRLWDQGNLIEQLFDHYEKLDEDFRTELPLKRIWTVALADDDG